MPGIVLVSHGNLSMEILKTVEMIMGHQNEVVAVGLHVGEGIEAFCERVKAAINKVDDGEGVLIFADLFGGTPFNSSAGLAAAKDIKIPLDIVTGMNLPMVMEACTHKKIKSLKELAEVVKSVATSGIKLYSDLIGSESL